MTQVLVLPEVASLLGRVAPKRRPTGPWTFPAKFSLYLKAKGTNPTAFARRYGFPRSTFQAWTTDPERKIPASEMARIAEITRLPADYWTNAAVPYPPPADYLDVTDAVAKAISVLPASMLLELLPVVGNQAELARLLAIRRAAQGPPP